MLGYLVYLAYTIFFNNDPFIIKWLEASFALFLALVLSYVIRCESCRIETTNPASGAPRIGSSRSG